MNVRSETIHPIVAVGEPYRVIASLALNDLVPILVFTTLSLC